MQTNHLPQEIIDLRDSAPMVSVKAKEIALSIKDYPSIDDALAWCKTEQTIVDRIIERLADGKRLAHMAWKEWCSLESDATDKRKQSIAFVKARAGTVKLDLDRKIRAEEERKMEAARKKNEKECEKKAEKLEKIGHTALAEAVREQVGNFVAPVVEKPKLEHGSVRTVWAIRNPDRIRMTREMLLFLTATPGFEGVLTLNIKALEERCEKLDGNLRIPGIEFYQKPIASLAPRRPE